MNPQDGEPQVEVERMEMTSGGHGIITKVFYMTVDGWKA